MKEKDIKWFASDLGEDFQMMIIGEGGYPIVLLPPHNFSMQKLKDAGIFVTIQNYIEEGLLQLYCPVSFDEKTWLNSELMPRDRLRVNKVYERMLVKDVIQYAQKKSGYEKVVLAGFDFGGYHAANLTFKHPQLISHLICMSAAFEIKPFLKGYYDNDVYFNNPPDYLSNLWDPWYLQQYRQIRIILGVGEWDFCILENVRMSNILREKNIPHWLDILRWGGHDWYWWREMFLKYVTLLVETEKAPVAR